jgi:hypothetical protein
VGLKLESKDIGVIVVGGLILYALTSKGLPGGSGSGLGPSGAARRPPPPTPGPAQQSTIQQVGAALPALGAFLSNIWGSRGGGGGAAYGDAGPQEYSAPDGSSVNWLDDGSHFDYSS